MKKLSLTVALLFTLAATGQIQFGDRENFVISSYGTQGLFKEYDTEIGADIEFRGFIYAKAGYSVNSLDEGHYDIHGAFGPRFTVGRDEIVSIYVGFRGAFVHRNGVVNPIGGFETGVDFNVTQNLLLGVTFNRVYHADLKAVYEPETWVSHVGLRVGYSWDWRR